MRALFTALCVSLCSVAMSYGVEGFGATVTACENSVVVSTAAGAPWLKAAKGMRLVQGGAVRTSAMSGAEIMYDDGTAVRLESNSHAAIEQAVQKDGISEYVMSLFNGRALNAIKRNLNVNKKNKFTIKSPVSVASVRGTVFVIDASTVTSTVAVYEGMVEAKSTDEKYPEPVQVVTNRQVSIDDGIMPGRVLPVTDEYDAYRRKVANLFVNRIEWFRDHMEEVRRMHQDYMDAWRKEQEKEMKGFRDQLKDEKKDRENLKKQQEMEQEIDQQK